MITTSRCILTRLIANDYDDVKTLYNNSEVRKFLGGIVSKEKYNSKFKGFLQHSCCVWVIRHKHGNEFIGTISLGLYHNSKDTELSYQLLPEWWSKGYATEVAKKIIEIGFKEHNLTRIVVETQTANLASCQLSLKLGMKLIDKVNRFHNEQSIFAIYRPVMREEI